VRIPAREGAATTRALVQANTPLMSMNADPAEGPVRDTIKGGPRPVGRGLLMTGEANTFAPVPIDETSSNRRRR
jgi:hypothetical protein